jgi:hypothetical protein
MIVTFFFRSLGFDSKSKKLKQEIKRFYRIEKTLNYKEIKYNWNKIKVDGQIWGSSGLHELNQINQ